MSIPIVSDNANFYSVWSLWKWFNRNVEPLVKVYVGFCLAVTCLGIGAYIKSVVGVAIIALGYIVVFVCAGIKSVKLYGFVNAVIDNG